MIPNTILLNKRKKKYYYLYLCDIRLRRHLVFNSVILTYHITDTCNSCKTGTIVLIYLLRNLGKKKIDV